MSKAENGYLIVRYLRATDGQPASVASTVYTTDSRVMFACLDEQMQRLTSGKGGKGGKGGLAIFAVGDCLLDWS
jgi:hypothetical protein